MKKRLIALCAALLLAVPSAGTTETSWDSLLESYRKYQEQHGYHENKERTQFMNLDGLYQIGKDIPAGEYTLYYNDMNYIATVYYSDKLNANGEPDTDSACGYRLSLISPNDYIGVSYNIICQAPFKLPHRLNGAWHI